MFERDRLISTEEQCCRFPLDKRWTVISFEVDAVSAGRRLRGPWFEPSDRRGVDVVVPRDVGLERTAVAELQTRMAPVASGIARQGHDGRED